MGNLKKLRTFNHASFAGSVTTVALTTSAFVLNDLMIISVAEADLLLLNQRNVTWTTQTDADKKSAIIEMTELVNSFRYKGTKVSAHRHMHSPA